MDIISNIIIGEEYMLYILRHGQTDWNALHRLQGRTDIPLNENGINMAKDAGEQYKDIKIDICYSSPLIRAYETAKLFIGERDIEIVTDDRLCEMSFGVCEGMTGYFDVSDHPISNCFNAPEKYIAVKDGESFDELFARTGDFIESVLMPQLDAGKDVLIVAHGAVNCSIISRFKHTELNDFWSNLPKNCEVVSI